MFETKKWDIPGMILLIDFEKAFDTVSWKFIDKVLGIFNFGDSFKKWIHTFYKDSQSCVIQNGHMSSYFNLGRGCRQGDPLSPYVFLLCAEILGILIRNNKILKGIEVFETEFRLSQYADDTSFFLDGTEKSLREALKVLNLFYKMSGLKINVEKTKVVWIGAMAGSQIQLCKEHKLVWEHGNFTVLGVEFNTDLQKMIEINFTTKMEGIKSLLHTWSKRNLTLFGKVTILKTLIIPKLNHLFSALPNPDNKFLNDVEKTFFKFIWNKSNDKIKRNIVIQSYENGGLNMTNISTFINSLKVSWMKRLINSESTWTIFIKHYLKEISTEVFSFGPKVSEILIKDSNPFWIDVFTAWAEFVKKALDSLEDSEVLKQPVWFNHKINFKFKKQWYENGIRTLYDLVDQCNGKLYSFASLKRIYGISGTFLDMHSFIKHFPQKWLEVISEKKFKNFVQPQQPTSIELLLKYKKGCSLIYKTLHSDKRFQINCIRKWNDDLNVEYNDRIWKNIFLIPFRATMETKLKEFQFKVIHRIIATKKFLYKIKLVDDDKCFFCRTNTEDLLHLFFSCEHVQKLWTQLKQWLHSLNIQGTDWSKKDIVLGIIGENSIINHLIMITKYFIYRASISKTQLTLNNLISCIKLYYRVEKQISKKHNNTNKFEKKWSSFVNVFENPQ